MPKEIILPMNQRYFTREELRDRGMTSYEIDKLVNDGCLIRYANGTYENTSFMGENEETDAEYTTESKNDTPIAFMPAKITMDNKGMARSLVHFVIPERLDSLQLVQMGVQTTLIYNYGPTKCDYEMVHFVLYGKGDVTIDQRRFSVHGGQIFYSPRNAMRYFECDDKEPWAYVWIGFSGEWAKKVIDIAGLSRKKLVADIANIATIDELAAQLALTISKDSSYIAVLPYFYKIIQELMKVRGYEPSQRKHLGLQKEQERDARIVKIVHYIENEYMKDISVNDLADRMSVSRAWLSRRFKEMTGKTIKEYVTDLRISHAKIALAQTSRPIVDIAMDCGYHSPMFFSRVFKQNTGYTPTQWRDRL